MNLFPSEAYDAWKTSPDDGPENDNENPADVDPDREVHQVGDGFVYGDTMTADERESAIAADDMYEIERAERAAG